MKPLKSSDPRLLKEVGDLSIIDIFPICVIWFNQCLYTLLKKKLSAKGGGIKKRKEKEGQRVKE